jgi:hypothetical protein
MLVFINYQHILQAFLWAFGVYWCYEVISRFREDLSELSEVEEKTRKAVIIGIWCVTIIIMIFLAKFTYKIASKIVLGIYMLVNG